MYSEYEKITEDERIAEVETKPNGYIKVEVPLLEAHCLTEQLYKEKIFKISSLLCFFKSFLN